jgi:hypothetical protein
MTHLPPLMTPRPLYAVTGLDELLERFEAAGVAKPEWTHETHLRVGAILVHRVGPEGALARLRTGIRRLNDAHGTVNSGTSGYHETITAAYVRFIAQFLSSCPREMTIDARVDELVVSTLGQRDFLLCFWSPGLLLSERARAEWVDPDLAPLPT